MVELLTVIAIIALLAAIIFPVYARAKAGANKSNDITSLNQLRTAIQLYRADQGGYPPAILGYATLYTSGPNAGNVIPANEVKSYLYPKRISSLNTLKPINFNAGMTDLLNDSSASTVKPVVFPNKDATTVGASPIVDTDGAGGVTAADDTVGARQAFGPADGAVCYSQTKNAIVAGAECSGSGVEPRMFYAISGYDVATVPVTGGSQYELRYTRYWTKNAIGTGTDCDGPSGVCGVGASKDDPRQLGYNDPPEDTVITWNSQFREYGTGGVPQTGKFDILLTVGGAAKPFDSKALYDNSWRQRRTR